MMVVGQRGPIWDHGQKTFPGSSSVVLEREDTSFLVLQTASASKQEFCDVDMSTQQASCCSLPSLDKKKNIGALPNQEKSLKR